MIKRIFITATGTDVGKTYTTLKIMEYLCAKGVKAVPFKPIETGVIENTPLDASKLLEKYRSLYNDYSLGVEDICPYRFTLPAAPCVAKGAQSINVEVIKNAVKTLETKADIVLIEGAGGLMTPVDKNFFMIDLALELADFTILVSHTGLGCINDALLSKKALEDANIAYAMLFNRREDDAFEEISKPFLRDYLGEISQLGDLACLLDKITR